MKPADLRGLYEEIANSISHAIGLGLAAAGWSALLVRSMDSNDPWRVAAALVFGTCVLTMYISSVLYHGFQVQPLKHYFRVFDHISIYFVIGGSFTPFLLVFDRSTYGWTILGIVWTLALLGVLYKLFFFGRNELESVGTYTVMSVVALLGIAPRIDLLPAGCVTWLVAGLVLYVIGVWFYLHDERPFHHTVWHFAVIGGTTCHFIGVWLHVVPSPT